MSIEVVDAYQLARLAQLDGTQGAEAHYLAPIIRRSPSAYIDNAEVRMEALLIDGKLLPIVINESGGANSNVCSIYAHYFEYAAQEFARRFGPMPSVALAAPRSIFGALLRHGSIDRTVFVNNWLLTTNPSHGLSAAQIAELTEYLIRHYPDSAIVFRSVNALCDSRGLDALRTSHYSLVPSRTVYLLDTASERYLERSNVQADLSRLGRTSYSIVEDSSLLTQHAARFAELYRGLYLGKHSWLNPQYSSEFFSLILEGGYMAHRAFIENDHVDAFCSYFVENGMMTASLIAYDLRRPQKLGLYRLAVARLIAEAAERKTLLNMSAGTGYFKMLRGGVPVQEYDAVYARHLPPHRRMIWSCLRAVAHVGAVLSRPPKSDGSR
jgi:hypothetical protein